MQRSKNMTQHINKEEDGPSDPSRDLYEEELYDCIDWSTDQADAYYQMDLEIEQLEADQALEEIDSFFEIETAFGELDELISEYDDLIEIGTYE